jgi:hypothetical protein
VARRWRFFPAGGGGGGLVVPTLGAGTPMKNTGAVNPISGDVQHTPAGTACIVRYVSRSNSTATFGATTATFQGQPVVFPSGSQAGTGTATNRSFAGIGYVVGLTPGVAGTLTLSPTNTMGDLVARVDDVANFSSANIGAVNADVYNGAVKNNHGIAVTTQGAASLLLGAVGGTSGALDPFTPPGGWTEQSEDVTGTSTTSDVAAAFMTKIGGAASTVETVSTTGSATAANWGAALLELKAA